MANKDSQLETILHLLDESGALEPLVMNVQAQTSVTDYMVICNGRSSRHVKAIAQQLIDAMKMAGFPVMGATGLTNGDWVLVDLGDFVIHVMQPEARAFYDLETLWKKAS